MKKLITFVAMFLFLGCFFFSMICKTDFRILLKGVAPQCSGMSYIVFYLFYSLFKVLVFYFQQVLQIPLWFTEKFSSLFFFGFHFWHHSAQEFSYFICFIVYLKLLLFYFWQERYSKFPFDLQKIFLFFFFGFAQEMKYFVWTWFSTTISFSNLSMWIKFFFFFCKLQLAAI